MIKNSIHANSYNGKAVIRYRVNYRINSAIEITKSVNKRELIVRVTAKGEHLSMNDLNAQHKLSAALLTGIKLQTINLNN